ncbi:MAG TPA: SCO family protein [Verrucomicrobiae bacterium]
MADTNLTPTVRRVDRVIWVGLGLSFPLVLLALVLAALRLQSPGRPLPVYGQVAEFTLTNQFGQAVSLGDLRGHPWVADIIFTRCPGPCLAMTGQMRDLQQAPRSATGARLVTLTTDPDFDTPPILKSYAERFGADTNRWLFLTGTKKAIASLAIDSLKLTALPKKPEERDSPNDLFVHSTIFVLVDKNGRLRGVYETTGAGTNPAAVKSQILGALRRLERER